MTSLWRNFSGNDFANSNWSCLLISASKFHWNDSCQHSICIILAPIKSRMETFWYRLTQVHLEKWPLKWRDRNFTEVCNWLLTDRVVDSVRHMGSTCIARVAQQCLYKNCPQMTEKEQWPPNNSNLNTMEIYLGSDIWNYSETFIRSLKQFLNYKSHQETILDNFLQVNKGVRVLDIVWQSTWKVAWRKTFWTFFSIQKKCSHFCAFALSGIVETIFHNVTTARLP